MEIGPSCIRRIINLCMLTLFIVFNVHHTVVCYDWNDAAKECTVEFSMDDAAVAGAPIGFSARVKDIQHNYTSFNYRWESPSAKFKKIVYNQSFECNITTTVEEVGDCEMKVWVDSSDGIKLCKATKSFYVSQFLSGRIIINQNGTHAKRPEVIATNTMTNVSFELYDPHQFFGNNFKFFVWGIDLNPLKNVAAPSFMYNFTSASSYRLSVMVSILVTSEPGLPKGFFGSFVTEFEAKNPIIMSNVTGNTSIQHGDVLDIDISCEGSSPITYCWHFSQIPVNISTQFCDNPYETSSCTFNVVRYFPKSGNYKLILIVDNEIDHKVNVYNINVFQRGAEPQLSPIIVPLACSSVALVIVVIGIMYFLHSRRNYSVEVADFDFQQSDRFEYHSFTDRMVEACKAWFGHQHTKPEKSSVYRRIPAQIT